MKIFQSPSVLQHLVIGNKIYNLQSSWRWALYCRAHPWRLFLWFRSHSKSMNPLKGTTLWKWVFVTQSCFLFVHPSESSTLKFHSWRRSNRMSEIRDCYKNCSSCLKINSFEFTSHLHSLGGISFLGIHQIKK